MWGNRWYLKGAKSGLYGGWSITSRRKRRMSHLVSAVLVLKNVKLATDWSNYQWLTSCFVGSYEGYISQGPNILFAIFSYTYSSCIHSHRSELDELIDKGSELAENTGVWLPWRGECKIDTTLREVSTSEWWLCGQLAGRCSYNSQIKYLNLKKYSSRIILRNSWLIIGYYCNLELESQCRHWYLQ